MDRAGNPVALTLQSTANTILKLIENVTLSFVIAPWLWIS